MDYNTIKQYAMRPAVYVALLGALATSGCAGRRGDLGMHEAPRIAQTDPKAPTKQSDLEGTLIKATIGQDVDNKEPMLGTLMLPVASGSSSRIVVKLQLRMADGSEREYIVSDGSNRNYTLVKEHARLKEGDKVRIVPFTGREKDTRVDYWTRLEK